MFESLIILEAFTGAISIKMKKSLALLIGILSTLFTIGQNPFVDWYSESNTNGIIIQNSYPKGGPYPGVTKDHFNHSYLVFFSRIVNEGNKYIELNLQFEADSFPIPNSPNTFVKLYLPSERMSLDKRNLFSYGIPELKSLDQPTSIHQEIKPKEDFLFYVVALFYQTKKEAIDEGRGGNRSELILKDDKLYYNLIPQVNFLECGTIKFNQ